MSTRPVRRCAVAVAAVVAAIASFAATSADIARAAGPTDRKEPYAGYLFPAGGCRGTTFDVIAGGQNLGGVGEVLVSGDGVTATVVRYEGGRRRLNGEQRQTLVRRLAEVRAQRRAELAGRTAPPAPPAADPAAPPAKPAPGAGKAGKRDKDGEKGAKSGKTDPSGKGDKPGAADAKPKVDLSALPDVPPFRDLDKLGLDDLDRVEARFLDDDPRRQPNAQIGETVVLRVTIDPRAAPGEREVRLASRLGLTNPVRFEVGTLPELAERESLRTDPRSFPVLVPPMLVNGQVLPGDVDRYRVRARRGQHLVIQAHARRLIPYLADAVPGWFQAVMSLRDAQGAEVAFADDWRFDPDPVLTCDIPRDGDYVLEIRDAIYRGREDFVYRVSLGQEPFITRMFPLGGRAGAEVDAAISGWNLVARTLRLDTTPGESGIRWTQTTQGDAPSNRVPYAVDDWPECDEVEPNGDDRGRARAKGAAFGVAPDADANAAEGPAQSVDVPRIVSGRIGRPGDVDVFSFGGLAGDEVVAEVVARRLGSPLDSLVRLLDPSGAVLAWNDDHEDKEAGLLTHHADSYVRARLPQDGLYRVQVTDAQGHGGDEYAYRLRIGPPRRDFALVATPSSVNVPAGRAVPMWVHAIRKDGFDGDIDLALANAPAGFTLGGARIPRGRDRVRVTLTAPAARQAAPVALTLVGRSTIGEREVVRTAVPSEDMMQAFAYRHLAASQELMVAVLGGAGVAPLVELPSSGRVRVPSGGSARVRVLVPPAVQRLNLDLELDEPPAGVTLGPVTRAPGGFDLEVRADATAVPAGYADNLIVEAFLDFPVLRAGATEQPSRRTSAGFLPAIPIEVVAK